MYVVVKDNVVSTVGYTAATGFFILCLNSELFWPMYGNRFTILVLSSSVAILLTSIACSIHLLPMLIGNPLSFISNPDVNSLTSIRRNIFE